MHADQPPVLTHVRDSHMKAVAFVVQWTVNQGARRGEACMFARIDLFLIAAGIGISVLGAALVDLWLIGMSFRSLIKRDGSWGAVGLLLGLMILGGIVGFAGLLSRALLDLQG